MKDISIEEQELIKINKFINDKYIVLRFQEGYKKSRTKCIIKCKLHGMGTSFGTPWIPLLSNLKNNTGCPKCKNIYIETKNETIERLKKEINPKYNIIGFTTKYTGKRTRCILECNIHGNGSKWGKPWLPTVDTLFRGFGCPKCSSQYSYSKEEISIDLKKILTNKPMSFIDFKHSYIGKESKCIIKCDIHGNGNEW